MPRGIYKRKKRFPARDLRQVSALDYSHLKPARRRPDDKDLQLARIIIESMKRNIDMIEELING